MHTTTVYLILIWIWIFIWISILIYISTEPPPTENTKHTKKNVGIKCKTDKYEKFELLYKLLKHKLTKEAKEK